jgi:hypothetical protein
MNYTLFARPESPRYRGGHTNIILIIVEHQDTFRRETTMTRFENRFPELAAELHRAPVEKQRAACQVACEYAVTQAKIDHPLVTEARGKMRAGETISYEHRRCLESLIEQLDNEYFDLAVAFDEGNASVSDYQKPFAKARAVSSVLRAFDADPYNAASEAIYEADAVTDEDDADVLVPAIKAVLK